MTYAGKGKNRSIKDILKALQEIHIKYLSGI